MADHSQNSVLQDIHNYNIDVASREIYLHSHLDGEDEGGVDYRSAIMLEKNIRHLNLLSLDPILIHMHIPGGSWSDCLGMFDAIRFSKARIAILAYGMAESCSGVLLQAPHLRILMPNTNVMIHYGSFTLDGEHSKAAVSSVQWNDRECEKMVDIFTERCMGGVIAKEKNWKKMMAKKHIVSQLANKCDWILTADEAVYYGFADGILGTKKYPNIDHIKNQLRK